MKIVFLLFFIFFTILSWYFFNDFKRIPEILIYYKSEFPLMSIILFILFYAIFVVTALPSLPLNLAAGFLWGSIAGGIYTALAVTIGSWFSFAFSRFIIGQPLKTTLTNKWFFQIQQEFDKNGWKFIAFARINPIFPTGPLNYFLGLTSVTNKVFIFSSFLFLLPPAILVAYIGESLQTFSTNNIGVIELMREIALFSASISILFILKYSVKIFKKKIDQQ